MVAVRRVKLVVVLILVFVGFIGLYQLEKRRQVLGNSGLFSDGKLKISWRSHKPVSPGKATSRVTPEHTVVTEEKTTKTNAQRVVPTASRPKVSNVNPEEEEEELLNNEIDETLDWVKRMGHERHVNQESSHQDPVTELRDIIPKENDERDKGNGRTTVTEMSDIFPTADNERDMDEDETVTEVRDGNLGYALNEVSPTVNDEGDSDKQNIDSGATAVAATTPTTTSEATTTTIVTTAVTTAAATTKTATTIEAAATTKVAKTTATTTEAAATTTTTKTATTKAETATAAASPAITTTETTTTTAPTTTEATTTTAPPTTTTEATTTTAAATTTEATTTHQSQSMTTEPPKGTSMYTPSAPPRVNTCNLPKLDPWDSSIRHLLKDVGFDPKCKSQNPHSLYEVVSNRLVLRDNSSLTGTKLKYFSLQTIKRTKDSDTDFDIDNEVSPINLSTTEVYKSKKMLASDFFRINYQIEGKDKERHYYARVVPRQGVIEKSREIRQGSSSSKKSLPLNVLILGFDSTSNANFLRKMPHTLNWLRTQKRSYFMKGYSIVGDATTPALTALLTGNHEYDLPEGRRGFDGSQPIDRWPWISKMYESKGYVTLYAEDDPPMSTFNLRLNGFVTPPYHHFMRPFWLAMESEGLRDEPGICSRDLSLANYTMEYLLSFFEAYKDTPKFAMGFLSYLTHAHPNHLSYGDFDVLYLLKEMKSRGYLDNTLLVILGDHGSRNDDVRGTMQGKLEERLPWLSISVPDWLESRHPELTAALANNEDIISSPFDLHATFQHVLTYPDLPDDTKTYRSLLTKMSRDRTCKDAGIDEHWCPCLEFKPVKVNNQDVQQAAMAVVNHINKLLNSTDTLRMSCHMINLTAVHNAMHYEPNEKVQRFSSTNQDTDREVMYGTRTRDDHHFLVTIETSPMGAVFEATVTMADDKSVVVNPNISRINLYGNQPKCIAKKYPYLRKYCVCKNLSR